MDALISYSAPANVARGWGPGHQDCHCLIYWTCTVWPAGHLRGCAEGLVGYGMTAASVRRSAAAEKSSCLSKGALFAKDG